MSCYFNFNITCNVCDMQQSTEVEFVTTNETCDNPDAKESCMVDCIHCVFVGALTTHYISPLICFELYIVSLCIESTFLNKLNYIEGCVTCVTLTTDQSGTVTQSSEHYLSRGLSLTRIDLYHYLPKPSEDTTLKGYMYFSNIPLNIPLNAK